MLRRLSPLALVLACAALAAPGAASAAGTLHLNSPRSADPTSAKDALRMARQTQDRRGARSEHDLTLVLHTLALKLPELKGADRRSAERLLARPTQGQATDNDTRAYSVPEATPLCGAHFCVHYVQTTEDAPSLADANANGTPDYVETTLREFENVYQVENVQMGWQPPKSDGTAGGDSRTDVYLANIGPAGLFGYAAVDPNQREHSQSAYLVLDNDYAEPAFSGRGYSGSLAPLQVTAAHEYNHVLQYAYDTAQDSWMLEATATWMEDKVYDDINDYLNYIDVFAQRPSQPLTQFNPPSSNDTNDKVYGDTVWNRFIDQRFGADTIRRAWEVSVETKDFAPAAYQKALSEKGSSFFDTFTQFAADTAEWRASNSPFEEGGTFPDMTRSLNGEAVQPENVTANRSDSVSGELDHTGYALINLDPAGQNDLTVGGTVQRGVSGAIAVVGRTGDPNGGTAVTQVTRLPKGGSGKVTLPNATSFSRVTAVIVNSGVAADGFNDQVGDWNWLDDSAPVTLGVNDFTTPGVRKQTPKRNARGVSKRSHPSVQFNEPVAGITTSSVKLTAGGRSVGIKVSQSSNGRTVHIVPKRALGRGRRYTIKLSSAVTDAAGNALPASKRTWHFTTAR
jgi:hypothetical protein